MKYLVEATMTVSVTVEVSASNVKEACLAAADAWEGMSTSERAACTEIDGSPEFTDANPNPRYP